MPNLTNFIIGDSTTFNTGNIALVRVAELTGTKSIEEDWMGMYTSANTGFSYMTSSGSVKLQTSSTGITVTGGIEVGGAASRFSNSVRFTANATFDDNSKAIFGDDSDLQIYHDGSNSYIDDAGTGSLSIRSNLLKIESYTGERMATFDDNSSVSLYYDDSIKLATDVKGIAVTGDVLDRDIPCLFNSNFFDGTATSIYVVPFNSLSESTVSNRTYYHNLTMPYAGKLVKVVMKNVSGTLSSGFTTQLFLYVNGSQQASSSELSLSNSAVTWTPSTSNTFSAGDELTFAYQKSTSGATFSGVSFGVAVELTDYDI